MSLCFDNLRSIVASLDLSLTWSWSGFQGMESCLAQDREAFTGTAISL